ncbi:MAG TPA: DUF4956 domain-containing protein [Pyrinomonadaceae bacterium]|nr:DUF4956 domain-containing protein [Pyrinomonadaceae bacterium]
MAQLDSKRKRETLTLVVVFVAVLAVSALVVYSISQRAERTPAARDTVASSASPSPIDRESPPEQPQSGNVLDQIFGVPQSEAHVVRGESWAAVIASITLRLLLAALLGAALAYRPRKRLAILKRNPYVAQTQILLAIVAAALMIIVGNNAARAFGIFAAVSVVRFRTNIRDPKEITVLLISLAVGLAAGFGRWDLALILTLFALIVLWVLEYREASQVSRTMDLTLNSKNVAATQGILRQVFERYGFEAELRRISRENTDEPVGTLVYSVDLGPTATTDALSEEILTHDATNVDSIEWEQKKSASYIYQ